LSKSPIAKNGTKLKHDLFQIASVAVYLHFSPRPNNDVATTKLLACWSYCGDSANIQVAATLTDSWTGQKLENMEAWRTDLELGDWSLSRGRSQRASYFRKARSARCPYR
jgi:hypothetical protein